MVSNDGETFLFHEPMKARLGVDYWIKRIALSVKHSLRHYSRLFFSNYGMDWDNVSLAWDDNGSGIPVQILVAGVHVMWCRKRKKVSSPEDRKQLQMDLQGLKAKCIRDLEENKTAGTIRRTEVKLHLLDYYTEVLAKDLDDVVSYSFDETSHVLRTTALNKTFIYGHEYLGQAVCFSSALTQGKEVRQCLQNVVQRFSSLVQKGLNSEKMFQVAGLLGKLLRKYIINGYGSNLKNFVIGTVILGSWLILGSFDCVSREEFEFLRLLALRVQGQEFVGCERVELLGREIPFRGDFHICLSAWNEPHEMARFRSLFRPVSLGQLPQPLLIKHSLTKRGVFSQELLEDMDILMRRVQLIPGAKSGDLLIKLCKAIGLAKSPLTKKDIYRQFLDLGAQDTLAKHLADKPDVPWPAELKAEVARQTSIDGEVRKSVAEHSFRSESLIQNFMKLKKCWDNFDIIVLNGSYGVMMKKVLNLLESDLGAAGVECMTLCASTHLSSSTSSGGRRNFLLKIQDYIMLAKNELLTIFIHGQVDVFQLKKLNFLISPGTPRLKLVYVNSVGPSVDLSPNTAVASSCHQTLKEDETYAIICVIARLLDPEQFSKMKSILYLKAGISLMTAAGIMSALGDTADIVPLDSLAITMGLLLGSVELPAEEDPEFQQLLKSAFVDCLTQTVATHVSSSKLKACVTNLKQKLVEENVFEGDDELEWSDQEKAKIKIEDRELKPQLSIENGDTDLFVPTKELVRMVNKMCFFLCSKVSVILHGERGSGKTTAINKAMEFMPRKISIVSIHLGNKEIFEHEDGLLADNLGGLERVIVVEVESRSCLCLA